MEIFIFLLEQIVRVEQTTFSFTISVPQLLFTFQETRKWLKLRPTGSPPTARSGAHSLSYESSIYIFGGYTRKGGEYFNDIYEYKTVENEW